MFTIMTAGCIDRKQCKSWGKNRIEFILSACYFWHHFTLWTSLIDCMVYFSPTAIWRLGVSCLTEQNPAVSKVFMSIFIVSLSLFLLGEWMSTSDLWSSLDSVFFFWMRTQGGVSSEKDWFTPVSHFANFINLYFCHIARVKMASQNRILNSFGVSVSVLVTSKRSRLWSRLLPSLTRSVGAVLVLPAGCKHRYSCYEGDERGGIAHSVNLSERIEVTRLEGDKKRKQRK